jgi:hypothetical protein
MLHLQNLTVREFVFRSFDDELLRPVPTLQVFEGEDCLINAVSLCDFSADPCQLEICSCGQIGCSSGSWVSFRRVNDFVVLIPAFRYLIEGDEYERMDFQPPRSFVSPDMSAAISVSDYSELVRQVEDLPALNSIAPLFRSEVLRIAQLQAPLQVLGRFPENVELKTDLLIAVAVGELADEVRELNKQLKNAIRDVRPVGSVGSDDVLRPLVFYLDGPGFPEWNVFQKSDQGLFVDLPTVGPVRV